MFETLHRVFHFISPTCLSISSLCFFFNDTATTEIYTRSLHDTLFFFNDTATTEIYTLSLHDALPIFHFVAIAGDDFHVCAIVCREIQFVGVLNASEGSAKNDFRGLFDNPGGVFIERWEAFQDRKSTRLNSSHQIISYAVFCLKKKNVY